MNLYAIKTEQEGEFNFFTQAHSHKHALNNLEYLSSDFKNIVKDDKDMVITIRCIKKDVDSST